MKNLKNYVTESIFDIDDETITHKSAFAPKTQYELLEIIYKIKKDINNYLVDGVVNLNFIDVSNITNFAEIFLFNPFEGYNFDVSEWDVSKGKKFDRMFSGCEQFNCDLSKWRVDNGESFDSMFHECKQFEGRGLDKWHPNKGIEFDDMFNSCTVFNADISKWKMSQAEKVNRMFYNCKSFKQDLSSWDVSNAWTYHMFKGAKFMQRNKKLLPEWVRDSK